MDELKRLAQLAKSRLKNGFWTRQLAEDREGGRRAENRSYATFVRAQEVPKVSDEDMEFYSKVREIVLSKTEVENPIGRLIDRAVYERLSYPERQRYIFSLAEKYRQVAATIDKPTESKEA